MKRITEEQRIEEYFMRETQSTCDAMLDKIRLIMRLRNVREGTQPRRGRPPKERPSSMAEGAGE